MFSWHCCDVGCHWSGSINTHKQSSVRWQAGRHYHHHAWNAILLFYTTHARGQRKQSKHETTAVTPPHVSTATHTHTHTTITKRTQRFVSKVANGTCRLTVIKMQISLSIWNKIDLSMIRVCARGGSQNRYLRIIGGYLLLLFEEGHLHTYCTMWRCFILHTRIMCIFCRLPAHNRKCVFSRIHTHTVCTTITEEVQSNTNT